MTRRSTKNLPIGEQIVLMRARRELTQRGLLVKCVDREGNPALSKAGLGQIETGDRYPSITTVEVLAKALRCTFVITGRQTYIEELAQ